MSSSGVTDQVGAIQKIDNALKVYYGRLSVQYTINGVGKFKKFCIDHGFEDNDMKVELNTNKPDDCSLIEFDTDVDDDYKNIFPFKNAISNKASNHAIYDIIKHCFNHGKPPDIVPFNMRNIDLNINDKVKDDAQQIYRHQLPILSTYFNEPALMHWTAVSYANSNNNNLPFLSLMVDSFMDDNVTHFLNNKTSLGISDWCNDKNNAIMEYIRKKNAKDAASLQNAMKDYTNRVVPVLQFVSTFKINDNVKSVSEYVIGTPHFINKLIQVDKIKTPFQLDLLIAVKDVIDNTYIDSDDDDDDDKDDDDKDNDDDDDDDDKKDDQNVDCIGDVEAKLKGAGSVYVKQDINADELRKLGPARYFRENIFKNAFTDKLKDKQNATTDDDQKYDIDKFPLQRRFCVFVDRRNPNNILDKNDEVIIFEPPSNCKMIPQNHIPEWHFESNRQCLIPRKQHTGDFQKEQDFLKNNDIDDIDKTITSDSYVKGQLITFSFHVSQQDLIKCYINWNAQTMRFHGKYLRTVLPLLFVESDANTAFKNNNQTIVFPIKDRLYEHFYVTASTTKSTNVMQTL